MKLRCSSLLSLALATTHLQAQTAPPPAHLSFDAASIKQTKPETPPGLTIEHGRFTANSTLFSYVEIAYNLMPSREQMDSMLTHLPQWVSTDRFEIHAVAEGNPTKEQMCLMLQSLLAERFKLQVHTVTEQVPVLALLLEKPGETGPKLRPHAQGPPCDVPAITADVFPPACDQFMAIPKPDKAMLVGYRNATMDRIAALLSSVGHLGGQVVDQTGLSGRFDFTIEFNPAPKSPPAPEQDVPPDLQGTTLQQALHEQLGLKLKATKAPLDSLVIDHVERPSEN